MASRPLALVKRDHEAASVASLFEEPVGFGALFGRVCGVDAHRYLAVFDLLANLIQQVGAAVVADNQRDVEGDVALSAVGSEPAADAGVRAAILDCAQRELVLDRAVGKAVDAVGHHLADLLGDVVAPVIVLASLSAAAIILVEAGLSFIGAGVQQPTPAWGGMVFEGYSNLFRSAWPVMAPGVAVVLMVVSFNFVGDGLRDALDPRWRNVG